MKSLLLLSFVEWGSGFQRPQHMAVGFARRGWRVVYASPGHLHRKRRRTPSGLDLPPNLEVMEPPALPGARHSNLIMGINQKIMGLALNPHADRMMKFNWQLFGRAQDGDDRQPWDALIFNNPMWSPMIRHMPAHLKILDAMDDLSPTVRDPGQIDNLEHMALEFVDGVWTGASAMAERFSGKHRKVRFIPCGVDAERFAHPNAAEVAKVKEELRAIFGDEKNSDDKQSPPLAGFFGVINERFNPDLLNPLLDAGWRVILIGPSSHFVTWRLSRSHSLRFLGPRPYASLPAYLACLDLALIPYHVEGAHRFLNPVKALEYLAGGKPVLSSALPEIEKFLGEYVLIGRTPEDWSRIAREWPAVCDQTRQQALRGQIFARARSWDAMVDEMSEDLVGV